MKNVLIIANLFHSTPRVPSIAKYLPDFGWQAIIVTGSLPETPSDKYEIIQTPFPDVLDLWKKRLHLNPEKGFQKQIGIPFMVRESKHSFTTMFVNFFKGILAYPDEHKGWQPIVQHDKNINELFQKGKIDIILSSSSPVTTHLIAKDLKRKYGIPWVADLRDLWTQNHNYKYGKSRSFFESKLEINTLKTADALVTVSPLWAEELKLLHGSKPIYSITNGFDPLEMGNEKVNLNSKFTVTYTGQIYTGKQNSSIFFSALKDSIIENNLDSEKIEVRFYGPHSEFIDREIRKFELSKNVKQYGNFDRKYSFKRQKESQLLLLFYWNDPKIRGWYPLKIFEYLAAERPVLVIGGTFDNLVKDLISNINAGVYCSSKEEVKIALAELFQEYKRRGNVPYKGNRSMVDNFSYREIASRFAVVLNSLTEKK